MTNTEGKAPVTLITQTPVGNEIEIRLRRWFQTREFWVNLAGWVATVGPIALTMLGTLNLSAVALFIWTIVLQTMLFAANQFLKNTSKSIVVDKHTMLDEQAALRAEKQE
jgi:hypothetical protein